MYENIHCKVFFLNLSFLLKLKKKNNKKVLNLTLQQNATVDKFIIQLSFAQMLQLMAYRVQHDEEQLHVTKYDRKPRQCK